MNQFTIVLADGTTHSVTPTLVDMVAYESTARVRKWGAVDDPTSKLTASAFIAWKALQRTGSYSKSFDDFLADVVDFDVPDEDGGDLGNSTPGQGA